MRLFSSSHWHSLTQNPPVLLHTDGPVQQDLQPGVQLRLAVQTPCPGLLELLGCRHEVIVLGTLSLAAQMVLQRFVWPPLICERLQQLQHLQHHRQDLQMQKQTLQLKVLNGQKTHLTNVFWQSWVLIEHQWRDEKNPGFTLSSLWDVTKGKSSLCSVFESSKHMEGPTKLNKTGTLWLGCMQLKLKKSKVTLFCMWNQKCIWWVEYFVVQPTWFGF